MDRLPYQVWGPPPFTPDGVSYAMFPDDMWGELSKRAQFVLRALLAIWKENNGTNTDASREKIRIKVNELREAKGLPPITSKRTITWYLCELVRLKVITRTRDRENINVWFTEFIKMFQARLNDPPGPVPALPAPAPAAPPAEPTIDLQWAEYGVAYCKDHGYKLVVLEDDRLELRPIDETVVPTPLDTDFKVVLKFKRASVVAFLKGTHQRE